MVGGVATQWEERHGGVRPSGPSGHKHRQVDSRPVTQGTVDALAAELANMKLCLANNATQPARGPMRCYTCNKEGHMTRQCPENRSNRQQDLHLLEESGTVDVEMEVDQEIEEFLLQQKQTVSWQKSCEL